MSSPPDIPPLRPRIEITEKEALERLSRHRAKPVRVTGKRLSTSIGKVTAPFLKDEGPGLARLKARWKDLVGERLAGLSQPIKLSGKKGETVLTLEILPAAAPLFQHQAEMLRQKLSVFSGGQLKAIKLVQANTARSETNGQTRTRPLSLAELQSLENALSGIKNASLSKALLAFGKAVYTKDG